MKIVHTGSSKRCRFTGSSACNRNTGLHHNLPMDMSSASMRDLARRLVAIEAARESATSEKVHEAVRVCDKLRISLSRFAGSEGFTSLLGRALAMSRAEVPSLQTVNLKPDCSPEGLGLLAVDATSAGPEVAVVIAAHLLGLLETFIGKPLTLRLVREAWPDASLEE
jgi:hypothetical protein